MTKLKRKLLWIAAGLGAAGLILLGIVTTPWASIALIIILWGNNLDVKARALKDADD